MSDNKSPSGVGCGCLVWFLLAALLYSKLKVLGEDFGLILSIAIAFVITCIVAFMDKVWRWLFK